MSIHFIIVFALGWLFGVWIWPLLRQAISGR